MPFALGLLKGSLQMLHSSRSLLIWTRGRENMSSLTSWGENRSGKTRGKSPGYWTRASLLISLSIPFRGRDFRKVSISIVVIRAYPQPEPSFEPEEFIVDERYYPGSVFPGAVIFDWIFCFRFFVLGTDSSCLLFDSLKFLLKWICYLTRWLIFLD